MSDPPIALARCLVDAGAGVSARRALGDLRGAHANRLRIAADRSTLRPGVFALVALPDGRGLALPLIPSLGRARSTDDGVRDACATALACARDLLDAPSLPALRFELEEQLALFGPSIGLGAALAFLAHFMPSRAPDRAILATGRLLPDGRITSVGHIEAKGEIADAERGARIALFPPGSRDARIGSSPSGTAEVQLDDAARPDACEHLVVGTLREAAVLVFGPAPFRPGRGFWSIDDLLRRARTASDTQAGLRLLEGVDLDALTLADRVRVLFDLGTLHRNSGNSRRAWDLHDRARSLLDEVRFIVGSDIAERCELEHAASALDELEVDPTIAWLRARLAQPFLGARNELRCRGMLAQALSISGAFAEALAVRQANLALHERSASLAKSLPMTLCQLTLDAAFAGKPALFDTFAARLLSATAPGDDTQARYSSAALLRGLVCLGRAPEALAWSEDRTRLHGSRIAPTLSDTALGAAPITTQPELTASRSLIRALRETGNLDKAIHLSDRALASRRTLPNLFRWTAALARLEQVLTLAAADPAAAEQSRSLATSELLDSHPRATAYYALLDLPLGPALSNRIARIWF